MRMFKVSSKAKFTSIEYILKISIPTDLLLDISESERTL